MLLFYFIFGSTLGSFLCLVAERVPIRKSIIFPASHCSYCQHKLRFWELIPIFSILFLRFRCHNCHQKLPIVYFFSEFICGILCVILTNNHKQSGYLLFFLFTAILLSLTDIFYMIVEPKLLYPLSIFLYIWHIYLALPIYPGTGLLFFLTVTSFNHFFPESIGYGDILLLTLWSGLLGSLSLIFLLLIASSSGLLFLLLHTLVTKKKITQLPFVPFLSVGLFFVLLFNSFIYNN